MKAVVKWVAEETFMGTSESGHQVVLDANKGAHAPSPMENVLISLGGCSSVDVVSILQKARQYITDCRCEISAERADAVPAVFTRIHLHFVVSGFAVAEKHVERAVALSADKYCSVAKMLEKAVTISHSFAIEEAPRPA
ncbi:OsmC family protein [Idiomarina xiamenensis]|uniref:OsmC family protein n=1 Tax=Idiomarina xiamenensis 10-D-4 TaxID=740709 RepID=K2K9P3_9GAMM|nr:OsmC family protein [Idiomarina xiamenensis]EKE84523.1 OsmC family protein [Idiomarina xiamenensis 10-D-4]